MTAFVTLTETFMRAASAALVHCRDNNVYLSAADADAAWAALMQEARNRIAVGLDDINESDLPPSAEGGEVYFIAAIEWLRSQLRHGEL